MSKLLINLEESNKTSCLWHALIICSFMYKYKILRSWIITSTSKQWNTICISLETKFDELIMRWYSTGSSYKYCSSTILLYADDTNVAHEGNSSASLSILFCSGLSLFGNSMLNSIIRSPLIAGSLDIGIPSLGTTFWYPGLKKGDITLEHLSSN